VVVHLINFLENCCSLKVLENNFLFKESGSLSSEGVLLVTLQRRLREVMSLSSNGFYWGLIICVIDDLRSV
jgi:hypothetical protein